MSMKKTIAAALVMVLLLAGTVAIINGMVSAGDAGEVRMVRDAVKNAALTCFAVEGAFPRDLDYLRENYGLAYDEEKYHVRYNAFASNQMPEIQVSLWGDGLI